MILEKCKALKSKKKTNSMKIQNNLSKNTEYCNTKNIIIEKGVPNHYSILHEIKTSELKKLVHKIVFIRNTWLK